MYLWSNFIGTLGVPYNAAYIGFVYTSLGLKGHHNGWCQREGQRQGSWLHLQTRGPRRESSASSFSFFFFKTRGGARSDDSHLVSICSCWEDRLITVWGISGRATNSRQAGRTPIRGRGEDPTCGSQSSSLAPKLMSVCPTVQSTIFIF